MFLAIDMIDKHEYLTNDMANERILANDLQFECTVPLMNTLLFPGANSPHQISSAILFLEESSLHGLLQ